MPDTTRNILIIKPSSLGDIVLALPALAALHNSLPEDNLYWLIRPEFAPLLENHPMLKGLIIFDRKYLGKAYYNPAALIALIRLILKLRRQKFDTVIDLQGLFRTAAFAFLSGSQNRIGMKNAREFARFFYNRKILQTLECPHLVDFYLTLARAAGAEPCRPKFPLPVSTDTEKSNKNLLTKHKVPHHKYAVLIPGSVHEKKCWPLEKFAQLANKINSDYGFSIVAVGSAAEDQKLNRLKQLTDTPITNLAGLTNLKQLVALLKNARIVITNDTGPGHIAAALKVPIVMIFGPSNPARIYPYKRPQTVAAIQPFNRGKKLQSKNPQYAVEAVNIEIVYQKVRLQLKQTHDQ